MAVSRRKRSVPFLSGANATGNLLPEAYSGKCMMETYATPSVLGVVEIMSLLAYIPFYLSCLYLCALISGAFTIDLLCQFTFGGYSHVCL